MNVNYNIDLHVAKLIHELYHLPKSPLLLPNNIIRLARTNYMFVLLALTCSHMLKNKTNS
jgi:hypothetical protein